MVMVTGDGPVHGVHLLKDGIRHQLLEPRGVYGAVGYQPLDHQRIAELVSSGAIFQGVQLGERKGRLAGERIRGGDAPERDIERAVSFIRQYR